MQLQAIPFHGTTISAAKDGDTVRVALRPACEAMGLDFSSQRKRLDRTPWAVVVMMTTTGSDGKTYEMVTIDRRTFTMWLATIDTTRLKSDRARHLVEAFQREAADVLDNYFHNGGAINPNATEHQMRALMFQTQAQMELCQAAKGLIHPDHLEAKARIILARGLGEHAALDPNRAPLYTKDYLKEKGLSTKNLRSISPTFGKRLKAAYIEKHGIEPEKRPMNLTNGQVKHVNAYTEADRPLMDAVWEILNPTPHLTVVA
ncbi:phage antirepressor N-terminal domain-containing protein [Dermabacter sp.]|uniref:phage antirepressor N-terminal domain-containing protein n=1 Tax=Dermabacter sp. TaxID=37640 RepID=UPI00290CA582|nr:phage antirepressor N-terminal domain-containing protein [Dermabacter sp.]MDU4923647.1 phage antirepressor N-terminal domain-containing protein [Dermabacter sp.]